MKRKSFYIGGALLLISSLSFQSCIGSFSLTNKVLTWNRNVNNKFVNELVFFAFWVLPVYEVTAVADLLVINSIEFWSGNKPLEAQNKIIETEHGNYQILANENGYKVLTPDGNTMNFDFDKQTQTWSFYCNEDAKTDFLKFKDNQNVEILGVDGNFVDVELSDEGIASYKNGIMQPLMACY
ncbi:MAG: DUF3332 domain-containing protein [Muribaculaceae bacterium]|nr:DUF3332 domain-containing protein [Muribaculaceae bacterium]